MCRFAPPFVFTGTDMYKLTLIESKEQKDARLQKVRAQLRFYCSTLTARIAKEDDEKNQ
jgi:hypothetical protein